ncbi:hypothetical protein X747_15010 [Mesorhizobium sp. LNJC384A00]|uniref:hypothetical protein n=1 Tax=unclassified Mesorhizobium TaxID=325217 RepID=UPI0003CE430A|nr:hypothetical protein [Mesorhizobium sp. LNJC384A00]ESY42072.1 hypothetical protein X747_15010 [Mesorhizobium sp. LNJC384A00]
MMTGHQQEAEASAALIAKQMLPLIAAALVVRKPLQPRPLSPKDEAIMVACGVLGRALDKVDASIHTKGERRARWELDNATRELRKLIDLREARYARK